MNTSPITLKILNNFSKNIEAAISSLLTLLLFSGTWIKLGVFNFSGWYFFSLGINKKGFFSQIADYAFIISAIPLIAISILVLAYFNKRKIVDYLLLLQGGIFLFVAYLFFFDLSISYEQTGVGFIGYIVVVLFFTGYVFFKKNDCYTIKNNK